MKILITGANGQLGVELAEILNNGFSEIGPISEEYKNAEITAIDIDDLDITDKAAVDVFFDGKCFDAVINCAAMTDVNGCETRQDEAYLINAEGPKNLALASKKIGARFVQVSTDYVFSGRTDKPYCEWDEIDPCGVYGKSKALGEKLVMQSCDKAFIVRTAWLFGYKGKNFIKTIITAARKNGRVKVVSDQFGNPTSANDLAHHILKLILTDKYGIYHCSGNGVCSWYELAKKAVSEAGVEAEVLPCTTEEYPTPAKRPAYSALCNTMLLATVGDEMREWQDSVEAYVKKLIESGF